MPVRCDRKQTRNSKKAGQGRAPLLAVKLILQLLFAQHGRSWDPRYIDQYTPPKLQEVDGEATATPAADSPKRPETAQLQRRKTPTLPKWSKIGTRLGRIASLYRWGSRCFKATPTSYHQSSVHKWLFSCPFYIFFFCNFFGAVAQTTRDHG